MVSLQPPAPRSAHAADGALPAASSSAPVLGSAPSARRQLRRASVHKFEAISWGSALGDWEKLAKVGAFPDADSHIDFSHKAHDRDLLLAIGGFCAGHPLSDVAEMLDRAAAGRSQKCRLAAVTLRAILEQDNIALGKALKKYLAYHEAKEFLKADMLCKISILGTFLYHAALRAGLGVDSATPYLDYIVRLDVLSPKAPGA